MTAKDILKIKGRLFLIKFNAQSLYEEHEEMFLNKINLCIKEIREILNKEAI